MKVIFDDYQYGSQIQLEPETLAEVNSLARFAGNAKREPPTIRLSFPENSKPYLYVHFKKRAPNKQKNSITNNPE